VAANLRGDLLGAETDLAPGDTRWLSPLPLWTGILAGPVAWAFDLTVRYALVKWTCSSQRDGLLHLITIGCFVAVSVGAVIAWVSLQHTTAGLPTHGGQPRERARFMAILGLTSSALFALTIVAAAIPQWVLDACR
jgi:hypothetical protein